jgi:hypothetical protein
MPWLDNLADLVARTVKDFLEFVGLNPEIGTLISALAGGLVSYFIVIGYFRRARHSHYGELDTIYFNLLRMRVDHPDVVDGPFCAANPPSDTVQASLRRERQAQYSYMIWTLLETIFDRAAESKRLQLTWQPIIRTEGAGHLGYFTDPASGQERQKAFQQGFFDFIRTGGFGEYTRNRREIIENREFAAFAQSKLGRPSRHSFWQRAYSFYWHRRTTILALLLAICGGLVVAYLAFSNRMGPLIEQSSQIWR